MKHIVLLGDSIFDNAVYVPREPPVIDQLKMALPGDWQATLLAVDGHVIEHIAEQLTRLPNDATHLVVSVGGNDALCCSSVLNQSATTVREALAFIQAPRTKFQKTYRLMLYTVLQHKLPTAVCTIYDRIPGLGEAEQAALATFNEIILREAFAMKVPVLDLRLVFSDASDFSALSSIEPSSRGGEKLAHRIAAFVQQQLSNHASSFVLS